MTAKELKRSTLQVDRLIICSVLAFYALSTCWIVLCWMAR
jgi:hypothetical protein